MDVAYIPQRSEADLLFPITVGELVMAGRRRFRSWHQRTTAADRAAASEALAAVNLSGYESRSLSELSGGQLQRAYIARALTQQASVVLLDEALSGVDQPTTIELFDLFATLSKSGTTFLFATHDLALARHRFDRLIAVNGTIQGDGSPEQVLAPAVLDSTFGSGSSTSQGGG